MSVCPLCVDAPLDCCLCDVLHPCFARGVYSRNVVVLNRGAVFQREHEAT